MLGGRSLEKVLDPSKFCLVLTFKRDQVVFLGLVGKNGAGETTIFRSILGSF